MREGTVVDAALIAASPSTKNKDGKRDPGMHQSKECNAWHFGLEAHIGVDAASDLTTLLWSRLVTSATRLKRMLFCTVTKSLPSATRAIKA